MMTKDQAQEWRQHPLTQKYHQFLLDHRAALMEAWAQGSMGQSEQMAAQAKCQLLDALVTMDDDWIANFYAANKGE